jgi:hypothetical protein
MRTQPRKVLAVAVLMLTVISMWLPSAHATRILKKDLRQLAGESAMIVIGTVVGMAYEPDPKEGVVFTKVRFARLRAIKGEQYVTRVDKELTLWFQGGLAADGAMEYIVGMPQLQLGQSYLLFLRGGEWTMNPIAGWRQGAFRLVPGPSKDSQMILTLDDAVVMGVRDSELELHPVRYNQLIAPYQASPKGQRGEVKLRTLSASSPAMQQPRKSIYREDNMQELETQDLERAVQAQQARSAGQKSQSEDIPTKTSERERRMIERLGRKPITLSEFTQVIQQLDKEVVGQYQAQPFHAEPMFLPKQNKALSPPSEVEQKKSTSPETGTGKTIASPNKKEQEEAQ